MVMENIIIERAEKIELNGWGPSIVIYFILNNTKCSIYFGENKNGKAIYGGWIYQFNENGNQIGFITKGIREINNYLKTQYNTGNIRNK